MSDIPPGTSLGYIKYPGTETAAVNLFCHEGFETIKPEEIEITIKPTDTYQLHDGIKHNTNNKIISHINIGDFEWFTGGLKIHSLADKQSEQFIQIRIQPTSLIITGIEVEIKPNYWCPNGAKFEIPRNGPLSHGITIGLKFCQNQQ